jgi:type II secretory pathway component HofQ
MDKDELKKRRKEAYQKAKAKRDADPRYQALKEEQKRRRKQQYRDLKEREKQKKIAEKLEREKKRDDEIAEEFNLSEQLERAKDFKFKLTLINSN